MQHRDPFRNLSPLDHRYWTANTGLFETLSETLSERAAVRYMVRAELTLLKIHGRGTVSPKFLKTLEKLESAIDPSEVFAEEQITRHNVRALVRVLARHVPGEFVPYLHLGATSADILDTAMAMRVRDAMKGCILPLLLDLLDALIALARNEAGTVQIGRTHGQTAVPITFGFAMAEYVSRLGQSLQRLHELSGDLRGKLSGAVGAYNATCLIVRDPEALERDYLTALGLKPAGYANQVTEPEHLLRLLLEINVCFGVIANLADDLRHLQRSEIGEVVEFFGQDQVGSSTMPQKRNPWNSEHVKSLWKAFAPRVVSFYMDQISEHQRDLTNSASNRFVADYLAGFAAAAARMKEVLGGLRVQRERMEENLRALGDGILAEPTYVLLALAGREDAHEFVRRATLEADESGRGLGTVLKEDHQEIWALLSDHVQSIPAGSAQEFYDDPALYRGLAEKRARELADRYEEIAENMRKEL